MFKGDAPRGAPFPEAFSQGLRIGVDGSEAAGAQELTDVLWVGRHTEDREAVALPAHVAGLSAQGHAALSRRTRGLATEGTLQRADGGGQRGLRDAAAAGCAGEIEFLAQRQEVTDLLH